MNFQAVKDFVHDKKKLQSIGWVIAAAAFVLRAVSFFIYVPFSFYCISFIAAGLLLFLSEKAKSIVAVAIVWLIGLWLEFLLFKVHSADPYDPDDIVLLLWLSFSCRVLLCACVVLYFKPTRIFRVALVVGGVLIVLHLMNQLINHYLFLYYDSLYYTCWRVIRAVFNLVFAVLFISRKFLKIEEILLKIEGFVLKILNNYRVFCRCYGYSVFVVGVIYFAVLLFWASPGVVGVPDRHVVSGYRYMVKSNTWDQGLIVSAITQLVACVIGGCFIFSQLSLARKLRERQITPGSAPIHLLVARVFFLVFAVLVAFGVVYMFIEDPVRSPNDLINAGKGEWVTYLMTSNIPLFVSMERHSSPDFSITLSAIVLIWHLIGASYVVALMRDNMARIQSMVSIPDNKTDVA